MRTHIMNKAGGYLLPMLLLLLLALASWRQMTTRTGPAEPTAGPSATRATPQDALRISEEQAITIAKEKVLELEAERTWIRLEDYDYTVVRKGPNWIVEFGPKPIDNRLVVGGGPVITIDGTSGEIVDLYFTQ